MTAIGNGKNEPAVDRPMWVQGWRRIVLAAGMLVYPVVTAIGISQYSRGTAAVAGYVIDVLFCACYVLTGVVGSCESRAWFWALFGIMTGLFVAELPVAEVLTASGRRR